MRIIAGRLGGRTFENPKGNKTHPMSDKARGALFNMLGNLEGLTLLDAFAGSGALSFEAISRGAASAIALDKDKNAQHLINQNAASLGISGQVKAIRSGVASWSETNPAATFDVVVCDPPYDNLQLASVQKIATHTAPDGLFILSWPKTKELPELMGLTQTTVKEYGDAKLLFYRRP